MVDLPARILIVELGASIDPDADARTPRTASARKQQRTHCHSQNANREKTQSHPREVQARENDEEHDGCCAQVVSNEHEANGSAGYRSDRQQHMPPVRKQILFR